MQKHHSLNRILPLLRCKRDGGKYIKVDDTLRCNRCGDKVDLIHSRIPNFIQEESIRRYESPSYLPLRNNSRFWQILYKYLPRPQVVLVRKKEQKIVYDFIKSIDEDLFILNIGSGDIDYGPRVVNVDIFPGKHVDILASADDLPFENNVFGGVMSLAVLEHIPDFEECLSEMDRILQKGGSILHTIPFIQPAHGVPRDYRRYTLTGIEKLFIGYTKIKSGLVNGPGSAIAWCLREYFSIATSLGNRFLYNIAMYLWGWIFLPLKFTDYLLTDNRFASQLASGVYYWGKKK